MPDNMPAQPEFPVIRKGGVDPASVESYLEEFRRHFEHRVAAAEARYSSLEIELEEARKREEAVHLTLVAATKTKEELLVNAQREADEMIAGSRTQSEELLAEAKKEAFRLVSEARESADSATGEARDEAARITAEAADAAEATRDAARREAIEMINTVESDTAALMAAQEGAVADMRRRYEEEEAALAARVEVLRATAADLEARLKAIASGTLGQSGSLMAEVPAAPAAPPPAPVTAAEPPTVAPKARRPIAPAAADGGAADAVAELAPQAVAELDDAQLPSQQREEAVAATQGTEALAASNLEAEFTDGLIDPDDEVGEDAATADQETPAVLEEVSSVVEPPIAVAEIETAHEEAVDEPVAAPEEELPDPFAAPAHDVADDATPAPAAEDVAEETVEEPEPEPVPAGVGASFNGVADGDDGNRKGSYYSRRSAKLPRIGTEAGRSALAAANAIRGATRGTPVEPTDVTAQSA